MPRLKTPDAEQSKLALPSAEQPVKETPDTKQEKKPTPSKKMATKDMPMVGNPENSIVVNGHLKEITSTRVIYQRNHSAYFYKALETYPLVDILSDVYEFDKNRDGDKCVFDWLIAVFDDEQFVEENYNDMDTDTIYRILEIFKRVNKITELEEVQKKRLAALAKMESQLKKESR